MRRPSDLELLDVWEIGQRADPTERALCFFGQESEGVGPPSALPIGERDSQLLTLRETLFGTQIDGIARCPQCGEQVELEFRTSDVRVPFPGSQATYRLETRGYALTFRLPTSDDLTLVASTRPPDVEAARATLLSQCVVSAERNGKRRRVSSLPRRVFDALESAMEQQDPQGDVRVRLSCPSCNASWSAAFDVAEFLWIELDRWARRTVMDVHSLGVTYGWSEADILEIPAWRREQYLELTSP